MRLSATTLQELMRCRRRFLLTYVKELQPKVVVESDALLFGTAFHDSLAFYDQLIRDGADRELAIHKMVRKAVTYPMPQNNKKLNCHTLLRSLIWYVDLYRGMKVLSNEVRWNIDVDGCEVTGFFDGLVEYFGRTYVLERKTSSSYKAFSIANSYVNSFQIRLYNWAAKKLGIENYGGIYLDFVMVSEKSTDYEYMLHILSEDAFLETDEQVRYLIRQVHEDNLDIPSQTSCMDFGRPCVYLQGCLLDRSERQKWLDENFVVRQRRGSESSA